MRNPAFDVTPHRYVTAIVCERGVARPPYAESLAEAGRVMRRLAALLALVAAAPLGASDWPRFRGPNGRASPDGRPLPASLAPETALWKVAVPPGYSSPVLFGERLYLTAYEGEQLLVLCLDKGTGRELWRREAPRTRRENARPPQRPGLAERRGGRRAGGGLLRRLRPRGLRPRRARAVADAARAVRQRLRRGRVADPRRGARGAGLRPVARLLRRGLRRRDRPRALARAPPRGALGAFDSGRSWSARAPRRSWSCPARSASTPTSCGREPAPGSRTACPRR